MFFGVEKKMQTILSCYTKKCRKSNAYITDIAVFLKLYIAEGVFRHSGNARKFP